VAFCEGGPCRIWRSGGFPKLSRKIFPLKPFFPFSPLFLPLYLRLQFLHPSKPSLQLSRSGFSPFLSLLPPFSSLYPLPTHSTPFLDPYRTPSETLRNPSLEPPKGPKKALKGPKRPFLGLFMGFPLKPPKGLKYPFLDPF